jgi:hypothetical protein
MQRLRLVASGSFRRSTCEVRPLIVAANIAPKPVGGN